MKVIQLNNEIVIQCATCHSQAWSIHVDKIGNPTTITHISCLGCDVILSEEDIVREFDN